MFLAWSSSILNRKIRQRVLVGTSRRFHTFVKAFYKNRQGRFLPVKQELIFCEKVDFLLLKDTLTQSSVPLTNDKKG